MDKKTIIRNFSRYAYTYDRYANVQKCASVELLKLIKENGIGKILEIGCGTGNYTLLLKEKFSSAKLKAIDISARMIEVASRKIKNKRIDTFSGVQTPPFMAGKPYTAFSINPETNHDLQTGDSRRVDFIVDDAESINLDEDFDLITSNACFQWFDDLGKAIIKYKHLLKKKGVILFSIFGPDTFQELNISLKDIFRNMSLDAGSFMAQEEIENILRNNFRKSEVKEARYKESFYCLRDLLNKIKYTGIRGDGLNTKTFLTPGILKKLEDVYLHKFSATDSATRHGGLADFCGEHGGSANNFGGKSIKATYQIFFCKAIRE